MDADYAWADAGFRAAPDQSGATAIAALFDGAGSLFARQDGAADLDLYLCVGFVS